MKTQHKNMKVVKILGYCLLFFSIHFALQAVPAIPIELSFMQPNGDVFKGKLKGDEWFNWTETLDQKVFVKNQSSGYFEYAEIKIVGDEEQLAPSGKAVSKTNAKQAPALIQIVPITRKDLKRLRKKAIERRNRSMTSQ